MDHGAIIQNLENYTEMSVVVKKERVASLHSC
jgi:hypothetical protein